MTFQSFVSRNWRRAIAGAACAAFASAAAPSTAAPTGGPPEKVEMIVIGDRIVDVAFNLGVLPSAMSFRGDSWALGRDIARMAVKNLGCPNYIVAKAPDAVPTILKETGIKTVLVEQSDRFDLHKPRRDPMNILPILEKAGVAAELGVRIEVVDFRGGVDPAIRRIGSILGRETEAEALIERRTAALAALKPNLPAKPNGLKAIVLDGVSQAGTGKAFVRVELPNGYSDIFLLTPLGFTNMGAAFVKDGGAGKAGYAMTRSLAPLRDAKPDVIVLTGDADAVQRLIMEAIRSDPALAKDVPALASGSVVSLPAYIDSEVIEYPSVLKRWAAALMPSVTGDPIRW